MRIEMVAPEPVGFRSEVADVSGLFEGSGGPLNKLRAVSISPDRTRIELEFELVHLLPRTAQELILDEVRRRASMHSQLARWVLRALPPAADGADVAPPAIREPAPLELDPQPNRPRHPSSSG